MTWEYDTTLATPKDQVRFMIGDTDDADQQLSDEEIEALLSLYGDAGTTAAVAARGLSGKYSRSLVTSKAVGDLKITLSERSKRYADLADLLEASTGAGTSASLVHPFPVAMGITWDQKQAAEDDVDRVETAFERGQDDAVSPRVHRGDPARHDW